MDALRAAGCGERLGKQQLSPASQRGRGTDRCRRTPIVLSQTRQVQRGEHLHAANTGNPRAARSQCRAIHVKVLPHGRRDVTLLGAALARPIDAARGTGRLDR